MSDLVGHVVNCLVIGHERYPRPNGEVAHGFGLRLGRWRCTVLQVGRRIGQPVNDFKGRCVDTTEIVVHGVLREDRASAERVVDDLCVLLSLAGLCQVRAHSYTFEGGTRGQSIIAECNFFRPLLELACGEDVQVFLEQCWPRFRRLKRSRKLPAAINYLVSSDLHTSAQVKLLLAFTSLECLKATYATKAGIPFLKGRFRKPSGKKKVGAPYGLEELLQQMLKDAGMRRGIKRAIALRNGLVHAGLTRHDLGQLSSWIDWTQSLLQEYLLRLLNYRGRYFEYSTGDERSLGTPASH